MSDYRRANIPGGTFFFTVVTFQRRPLFQHENNCKLLGDVIRECKREWPFLINAMVLLPDHLHAIWTMPRGDTNYPARWSIIKKNFTCRYISNGGSDRRISPGQASERRRGIWQRRFWEHAITDEDEFQNHFDYIHFNPVKHQHAKCPRDWGPSSFHRYTQLGVYPDDWGCGDRKLPSFLGAEKDYGEPT